MPRVRCLKSLNAKNMEKKYELTDDVIYHNGRMLHRIRALRDFSNVRAGDLGGYIQTEYNLSHEGNAWVDDDAKVYDNAQVCGDALIYCFAEVCDNVEICENAEIYDYAKVSGYAVVYGNARVYNSAKVYDKAKVFCDACVCSYAIVYGRAKIYNKATISGYAKIHGEAEVYDDVRVWGDAEVCGRAGVCGNAHILGDAKVNGKADYIVFKNFWSSGRYFTWTRSNNKWAVGCFYGTGEELIKKAYKDSEKSGREYERVVRYVESILADEREEENKKYK